MTIAAPVSTGPAVFSFYRAKCYALHTMEWQVQTLADTETVAHELLASLEPANTATVLALQGDLGAGKTTFVQALAGGVGVAEPVTSPTFVIQKSYAARAPWQQLVHIDAYRLDDPAELSRLGFAELLSLSRTLVCIEWAERVAPLLPKEAIHLSFTILDDHRCISAHYAKKN